MVLPRNIFLLLFFTVFDSYASEYLLTAKSFLFPSTKIQKNGGYLHIRDKKIINYFQKRPSHAIPLVDFSNKVVIPGLIDTHTLLLLTDRTAGRGFDQELLSVVKETQEERIKQAKIYAEQILKAGFTTIRDLGNSGFFLDHALSQQVSRGDLIAPRIFYSGPPLAVGKGQFPQSVSVNLASKEYQLINGKTNFEQLFKTYKDKDASWIKIYADNDPGHGGMPINLMQKIVKNAHKMGFQVAAHASMEPFILNAVLAGVDTIQHGYNISQETLETMKKKGTFLIPTDFNKSLYNLILQKRRTESEVIRSRRANDYLGKRRFRFNKARKAGVPIAFGSDYYLDLTSFNINRGRGAIECLLSYSEAGMSNWEVLRTATTHAAKAISQPELGSLKPQATADLVILSANPLKNISALKSVHAIIKEGKIMWRQKVKHLPLAHVSDKAHPEK